MTSKGAKDIFSKVTFLKSEHSNKNHELCHGFVVKNLTKSLLTGGVAIIWLDSLTIRSKHC